MTETMYPSAIGVRADLDRAHRRVWDHVSVVGEWWSAAERRAMAGVVRDAFNDREPSRPWSPAAQDILRWSTGADILPATLVDALYRMTVHAHTITESWYRQFTQTVVDEQAYVELCGIVTSVVAVCSFARTVGAEPPPFPVIAQAENCSTPARVSTEAGRSPRNWVPVTSRGTRAPVVEALSISQIEYDLLWDHLAPAQYMSIEQMGDLAWTRGTLSRAQAELLAGRVAALRQCFY